MPHRYRTEVVLFAGALSLMVVIMGCSAQRSNSGMNVAKENRIRLEHTALNVADPIEMTQWYVENLNMKVLREGPPPVNGRFLADSQGNMMLELYHNPPDAVPDYASMDPLLLHVAFLVDDVDAIRQKLLAAGATSAGEVEVTGAGDKIAMLRDPWGLAIQFVHRADPMLTHQ